MALRTAAAPTATILIRIMVGAVFLAEGIQKLLYPAEVGAGRFSRIGMPYAEWLGPFVFLLFVGPGRSRSTVAGGDERSPRLPLVIGPLP